MGRLRNEYMNDFNAMADGMGLFFSMKDDTLMVTFRVLST